MKPDRPATFTALLSLFVGGALLLPPIYAERQLLAQDTKAAEDTKAADKKPDDAASKTDTAAPATKPKVSDQVQFYMPDGDVLVGIMLAKQITVATEFGTLTIPTAQIRSFVPGLNSRPKLLKQIEGLIAKLASSDSAERDRAHKELATLGPKVGGELRRHKGGSNADRAKHIETLLTEFEKRQAAEEQAGEDGEKSLAREDTVVTNDFTVLGKISPSTFQISTKFGTLTTDLASINRAVRTGQGREAFSKIVDVTGQHLMQRGYKKSTIQVRQGDRVTVTATGYIVMSPWGSSTRSTPDGSTQWGQYNGFPTGCLVAKIGNGKPFRIGSRKTFTAKTSGTIHFGISMNSSYASQVFPGTYKVKTRVSPKNN